MFQEGLIQGGNLLAGGTIDEHRVEDVHLDDGTGQTFRGIGGVSQLLFISGKVDAVTVKDILLRSGDTHHIQLQSLAHHQFVVLLMNLLYQHAAYRSSTADEEVEHLVF